jgi:CRP-like cAMP-binding protein
MRHAEPTTPSTGRPVRQNGAMADLLELSADLPVSVIPAGDVLIEEGAEPTRMYVLVSGSVTVERDEVAFARIDSPGSVFGEMSVVLGRPATATVRATTDVEVRVIGDPEAFLTERPGAALIVLRTTAARLDGLTQYLVDVKSQFAGQGGHLGMVGEILDTLVHHQAPAARTGSSRDPEGDHQH